MRINPTERELEMARLFAQGLTEESSGDLLPLPSMPLLAPPPAPGDRSARSTASAVDDGEIPIQETGEQPEPIDPQMLQLEVGMEVELPDGTVDTIRKIDRRKARVGFGSRKARKWYSLKKIRTANVERIVRQVSQERREASREEGVQEAVDEMRLPPNLPEGLFRWQLENIDFVMRHGSALIADEMGLGKTLSAIACIEAPAVIVCPALLKVNWAREINQWRPELSVMLISGKRSIRVEGYESGEGTRVKDQAQRVAAGADVVVLNYEIIDAHLPWLLDRDNRTVIADEAHYLKSFETTTRDGRRYYIPPKVAQRSKAFAQLIGRDPEDMRTDSRQRLLLLTGTPILNRVNELWPLLYFLDPSWTEDQGAAGGFRSRSQYCFRYCAGEYQQLRTRSGEQTILNCNGRSNSDELHARVTDRYMTRHTKEAELTFLPDKMRTTKVVELSPSVRRQYIRARDEFMQWVAESGGPEAIVAAQQAPALVRMTKLRALSALGKAPAMAHQIVSFFQSTQRPLVVMGRHRSAFDEIERLLDEANDATLAAHKKGRNGPMDRPLRYGKVLGGMTPKQRQKSIDDFQKHGTLDVLLYSIPLATGTTLTRATDMFFFEREWRPADNLQAEDRIHRIGQENQVSITYYDGEGTLDLAMGQLLMDKTQAAAAVIDGVELDADEAARRVMGEMWGKVLGAEYGLRLSAEEMDAAVMAGHREAESALVGVKRNPPLRLFDENGEWIDFGDIEDDEDDL